MTVIDMRPAGAWGSWGPAPLDVKREFPAYKVWMCMRLCMCVEHARVLMDVYSIYKITRTCTGTRVCPCNQCFY